MNKIAVPEKLKAFFAENPRLALAFSGGVDSAYLLYAAKACGCVVRAYYVKSPFQPMFELKDAQRLADELNGDMKILHADVLADERVKSNPENRCYFCKRRLFERMLDAAKADGFSAIMDGTNASDDASDRPGMKALAEMKVLSPLRICGITKPEVREYSREAGLFTWNKPAYACLATRIPAGREITPALLEKIEGAEDALFKMNYTDFRVRLFGDAARLQLPEDQMARAAGEREDILKNLSPWFDTILLDLKGR